MTDRIKETGMRYIGPGGINRQQLYERVRRILDRLPDAELEDLPSLDDFGLLGEIESRLAGQAASENAMGRALLRGHKARTRLMHTTEMLPMDKVAKLLEIQPESVRKRIQRGGLLAVKQGPSILLPAFQFRENRAHHGMSDCLAALENVGDWTRLDWFMTPHPDLAEQTPAECLPRSPEQVIAAAERFGEQGGT
jgi:hypothetical protein